LLASVEKTTYRPVALIAMPRLNPVAWSPPVETLTRAVVPATRSRTKMSLTPLVSAGTRFVAMDSKATYRPLPLILTSLTTWSFACAPLVARLTRLVVRVHRSRTNASRLPFVSPGTRLGALDGNATYRPFPLMDGEPLVPET
jgi:hypothetical protein